MNYITEAIAWILDPANAGGSDGVWARSAEHLWYTLLAVAAACVIAIPLGYLVGHTRRGRGLVVVSSGAARALPTLGVVTLVGLVLGIGLVAPLVALVLLAVPSVLAGAYAGLEAIDPRTVDAARAMGMSEWQVLTRVEIPLGLPLLLGGIRSATLQVIATATLAAYVGAGGLGRFLFLGLKTQDYPQMLAAALLVVLIALILEGVFELAERQTAHRLHTT
ncbi:MAG TPA: ABC transporter permease [Micropruina sp.]|mgnify:FL=1|nr:ABC transporter permease [Propionibacterium sp.]HMQ36579.1 ABC transporter permease [Micropruina sp.]HMR20997.1 ABC transporter permease [Micropruina sp.]